LLKTGAYELFSIFVPCFHRDSKGVKPELVLLRNKYMMCACKTKSRYALRFPNWGKPTRTMSSPHSTLLTPRTAPWKHGGREPIRVGWERGEPRKKIYMPNTERHEDSVPVALSLCLLPRTHVRCNGTLCVAALNGTSYASLVSKASVPDSEREALIRVVCTSHRYACA